MRIMNILGIAVAAGAGYLAGMNHKKIRQFVNSFRKKETKEKDFEEEIITLPPPIIPPKPPTYDTAVAQEEFRNKVEKFSGAYEAIYQVANGTSTTANEVLADWNTRIHYLNSCPNVQKLWSFLFTGYENLLTEQQAQNAKSFVDFLFSAGIERDNQSEIIIDNATRFKYYTLNNEEFVIEQKMKVMLPCWSIDDKVLEKGILTLS